jgi:hypothetical protein
VRFRLFGYAVSISLIFRKNTGMNLNLNVSVSVSSSADASVRGGPDSATVLSDRYRRLCGGKNDSRMREGAVCRDGAALT